MWWRRWIWPKILNVLHVCMMVVRIERFSRKRRSLAAWAIVTSSWALGGGRPRRGADAVQLLLSTHFVDGSGCCRGCLTVRKLAQELRFQPHSRLEARLAIAWLECALRGLEILRDEAHFQEEQAGPREREAGLTSISAGLRRQSRGEAEDTTRSRGSERSERGDREGERGEEDQPRRRKEKRRDREGDAPDGRRRRRG